MIIKLKCVGNIDVWGDISDYLTVGKVYEAVKGENGDVALICDEGGLVHDNVDDNFHGKWEVVSE